MCEGGSVLYRLPLQGENQYKPTFVKSPWGLFCNERIICTATIPAIKANTIEKIIPMTATIETNKDTSFQVQNATRSGWLKYRGMAGISFSIGFPLNQHGRSK